MANLCQSSQSGAEGDDLIFRKISLIQESKEKEGFLGDADVCGIVWMLISKPYQRVVLLPCTQQKKSPQLLHHTFVFLLFAFGVLL
jgi:hypothetical protein